MSNESNGFWERDQVMSGEFPSRIFVTKISIRKREITTPGVWNYLEITNIDSCGRKGRKISEREQEIITLKAKLLMRTQSIVN